MSNERRRRFDGWTCLVTGGGRGIGRAVAVALAEEGAFVGVLARTRSQCDAVVAKAHGRAVALEADVTDLGACERAVANLYERVGPVRAVVNAAGISPVRQPAVVHDTEAFRQMLATNVLGVHVVARAVAPSLLPEGGSVVNVASVLGTIASPRLAGYGASKAAVVQLTRTLAREWGAHGVRVNAVCPGYVRTDMTAGMLANDGIKTAIVKQTALGRVASMPEIVAPILFLLSDEAAYITGAALMIDGGMAA